MKSTFWSFLPNFYYFARNNRFPLKPAKSGQQHMQYMLSLAELCPVLAKNADFVRNFSKLTK